MRCHELRDRFDQCATITWFCTVTFLQETVVTRAGICVSFVDSIVEGNLHLRQRFLAGKSESTLGENKEIHFRKSRNSL